MGVIEDRARKEYQESQRPMADRQEEARRKEICDRKGKYLTGTLIQFLSPQGTVTYNPDERWDAVATISGESMRFTTTTAIKNEIGKAPQQIFQLALIGRCPRCNGEAISGPIRTIAHLGQMLEKFEPGEGHTCGASSV